jgi:hypothetical protein
MSGHERRDRQAIASPVEAQAAGEGFSCLQQQGDMITHFVATKEGKYLHLHTITSTVPSDPEAEDAAAAMTLAITWAF